MYLYIFQYKTYIYIYIYIRGHASLDGGDGYIYIYMYMYDPGPLILCFCIFYQDTDLGATMFADLESQREFKLYYIFQNPHWSTCVFLHILVSVLSCVDSVILYGC